MAVETQDTIQHAYPTHIDHLQKVVKSGKISGAYCFVGIPGGAQEALSEWFCEQLLEQPLSQGNSDFLSVGDDRSAPTISMEDAQRVRSHLSLHANANGRRIALIRDAHRLNASAANALLKTIEEPPARAHVILYTAHPDILPQTIQSRVQHIRTGRLSHDHVRELLGAGESTEDLTHFVNGQLSRILTLQSNEEEQGAHTHKWWKENSDFWLSFLESDTAQRDSMLQERFFKEKNSSEATHQLRDMLVVLEQLLHDQLVSQFGLHAATQSTSNRINQLTNAQPLQLLVRRLRLLTRLQRWTTENTNKKMIFEYLTFVL